MKMTKPKETKKPKTMPLAIMIAVGKPRAMPTRGGRIVLALANATLDGVSITFWSRNR